MLQATPERLARVQEQVRQQLQEARVQQLQQAAEPQPKLSVRALLGHFESQRQGAGAAAATRASSGASPGATTGATSSATSGHTPGAAGHRSYGFGSCTAKTTLRKAVSQPAAPSVTTNSSPTSNNNKTSFAITSKSSLNGNNINNKLASSVSTASNSSRKSFLDSIIAGASDDRVGSRHQDLQARRSSATMEEVNNLLNAVTASPAPLEHGPRRGDRERGVNGSRHHALRKTNSESTASAASPLSPASPAARNGIAKVASQDGSQDDVKDKTRGLGTGQRRTAKDGQDIPSIVDQLPDDDRPQESRRTTSQWDPVSSPAGNMYQSYIIYDY